MSDDDRGNDDEKLFDENAGVIPIYGRDDPEPGSASVHFKTLGHSRNTFYFLPRRGKQVIAFKYYELSRKTALFMLAPRQWWETEFPAKGGFTGGAVDAAVNFLIARQFIAGVYREDRVRGLGAWIDQGRAVIHAGDCLYIDGIKTPLLDIRSKYVYEELPALGLDMAAPMRPAEARKFVAFAQSLNWGLRVNGDLLAGWFVAALASGAMTWRPHALLTGPRGCGKSWVLDVLIQMAGAFSLAVKGETTAAGVRQSLQSSSLPVLFDEAEGDSQASAKNIAAIISLMRQASADGEAAVVKGSASGEATSYAVRSSFMLSAIRDPIEQAADESRITVMSLGRPTETSQARFHAVTQPLARIITDEQWARRFRSFVFSRLHMLKASAEVFAKVGNEFFEEQRMGDQIGAMAAGVHVITSQEARPPTQAEALEWYRSHAWIEQNDLVRESSDEDKMLQAILQAVVRVDKDMGSGSYSVGEMLESLITNRPIAGLGPEIARADLTRRGIKLDRDGSTLHIATHHRGIMALLEGTSWPKQGWARILVRLPGAEKTVVQRFSGSTSRCISIPTSLLGGA